MAEEKRGESFVMKEPEPIQFTTFVLGLAHTSFIHLGDVPNPDTGKAEVNLPMARESIELLGLLREKTRGNLTTEEERIFEDVLARLRLRYVEAARR